MIRQWAWMWVDSCLRATMEVLLLAPFLWYLLPDLFLRRFSAQQSKKARFAVLCVGLWSLFFLAALFPFFRRFLRGMILG